MNLWVILSALILQSILTVEFVSAGWTKGQSLQSLVSGNSYARRRPTPGLIIGQSDGFSDSQFLLTQTNNKQTRLRPPLNRPRPKTGIQRRTSGVQKDVAHFYLYPDPKDTTYMEEIVLGNNASLSRYRKDYYPIILIHGYMQNYSNLYPQRTKDAYLSKGTKANVIVVDWQGFSQPGYGLFSNMALIGYPKASRQVARMSRQISDLIMFLLTQGVLTDPSKVHLVGSGLGAQIAGVTGHNFKRATGMVLGRISGLNPSGLQYHYTAMSEKLDKTDAAFVDVTTTSSPYGIGSSIGHVDFYPNGGGPTQPGCKSFLEGLLVKDIPVMEGSCAHNRAWEYFTDSIYNKSLFACQSSSFLMYKMKTFCTKPVIFGENAPTTARGDYFLEVWHKD